METWEGKCAKLRYSCTVPPSHASVEAQPAHCRRAGAVPGSVTGDQLLLIQPLMRRCVLSSHADVCVRSWSSSSSPPQQRGLASAEHLGAHPGQRPCSLFIPHLLPQSSLWQAAAGGVQAVFWSRAPALAEHPDVHPCQQPCSSLVAVLSPHETAVP